MYVRHSGRYSLHTIFPLSVTEDKWWGPAVSDYNLTKVAMKETHKLFDGSEGNLEILMAIKEVL
jgi:hypothetical protein